MSKFTNLVSTILSTTKANLLKAPTAMFRGFVAAVLAQFSFLSFLSITMPTKFAAVPVLTSLFTSFNFWWGLVSAYGAASLIFECYVEKHVPTMAIGYVAAISSLCALSYDFMLRKPPTHAGGILTATATIFLGGILYERLRHRQV